MLLAMVVAVARNGVIGNGNQLPWRLPDDLRRFKELTLGKPVIMGRRTFESIGRPLSQRHNIVVSRHCTPIAGCTLVNSVPAALSLVSSAPEAMVIGGAQIYSQCLARVDIIHLTRVHADVDGDALFPQLPQGQWQERLVAEHPADDRHAYAFSYCVLSRAERSAPGTSMIDVENPR